MIMQKNHIHVCKPSKDVRGLINNRKQKEEIVLAKAGRTE